MEESYLTGWFIEINGMPVGEIIVKTLLIMLSLLIASAAMAQESPKAPQCFQREGVTGLLMRQRASPVAVGRMGDFLLEIWSDGKEWLAYRTARDGTMCLIANGQGTIKAEGPRCIDPIYCPRI